MKQVTLVLGGARSGKSAYAESLAKVAKAPVYVATAEHSDSEMDERIALHRARRGPRWRTVEEPVQLAATIAIADEKGGFILIDCATVWLNNLLYHGEDVDVHARILCDTLADVRGRVVIVANEVGLGIVPENALARRFRDAAGRLNQAIASVADEVVFVTAGLPTVLKRPAPRRQGPPRKSSRRAHRA